MLATILFGTLALDQATPLQLAQWIDSTDGAVPTSSAI